MTDITTNTKGTLQLETVWENAPGDGPNGVKLSTGTDTFVIWFDGEDAHQRAQQIANLFIEAGLTNFLYELTKDREIA
jgi:hypothetical protein